MTEDKENTALPPEEAESNASDSLSIFQRLRKHILPIGIALLSLCLAFVIYVTFLKGDDNTTTGQVDDSVQKDSLYSDLPEGSISHKPAGEPIKQAVESDGESAGTKASEFSENDSAVFVIDTAEIMKELEFLFINPEFISGEAIASPEDSVDTLNWLEKEMIRLNEERSRLEDRIEEMKELEKRINEGLAKIDSEESSKIIELARLYDGMRPEAVARLFANLEDDIIITVLPKMKKANAAKILAQLPPERAARISTNMITLLED